MRRKMPKIFIHILISPLLLGSTKYGWEIEIERMYVTIFKWGDEDLDIKANVFYSVDTKLSYEKV